ncbi:MAG: ACP S-malonyltransferase [Pseudomonadota bacterium]|nr:ACP S-malonyltransferase [Pseudomonadota bacterium]
MKTAIVFPGQGSQTVGMGKDLAFSYPEAKEIFERVDEALSENLSGLIWEGDIEKLTETQNAQPALMATSMAILASIKVHGFKIEENVQFVAGHSLGEYSALCASESISLEDTAKLLRVRGNAMQSCVRKGEGVMVAIMGLKVSEVEEIVSEASDIYHCQVANDNDPSQVVISGDYRAVSEAAEIAKKRGAKRAVNLNVSAPFHSSLMLPAAIEMQKALASVEVRRPKVPVVMNTRASAITDEKLIREYLVDQVTASVRWRESILFMIENGVTKFLELGSGKVLTGLLRRIDRNVTGISVSNPVELDNFVGGSSYG